MHIVLTIANASSCPYFEWFAKKATQQQTHTFSFVALFDVQPEMIKNISQYGWDCHWIKFDHKKRKMGMLKAFFKAYSLLRKIKPDLIQTNLFDDSLPVLLAAKLIGIKKRVLVKQDTTFHYYYAPKWVLADKFNNYNATDIVPVSREAEKFILEKENATIEKITMIHHGIPSVIFTKQSDIYRKELIKKYDLEGKIVIGTVARLIEWKGYRYIIEAAVEIIKKHPNSVFLFVGEGEQKKELEKLALDNNVLSHIIFTGWIDRAYIPSLYSILDVYLHTASFEPFGFVIPEAMMNQAPTVSTPTGSALDAIEHKVNGYLCKYKDTKSTIEGVLYTIENGKDFKLKGKQTAIGMYEFDIMYNNYIKLYEK